MGFPLRKTIQVSEYGPPKPGRLGVMVPGPLTWVPKKVFGWAVVRVEEEQGDSVMRLIDDLQLIAPPGTIPEASNKIKLPDGSEWSVQGNAEDYNANPWWEPGLVIFHCRKVTG